jgi:maltose O-acetyltransferase
MEHNTRLERLPHLHRQETAGLHWRLILARLVLAPLPIHVGPRLRSMVLRIAGFRIGRGTLMSGTPTITGPKGLYRNLIVGRECYFNVGCSLDLGETLTIGDRVSLGHGVMLLTTSHDPGPAAHRAGAARSSPVSIGEGAWLGTRCVVLPGVQVGAGAIVGAGAVVNRDVPPHTVVAGVPAKVIRQLDPGEK